MAPHPLLLGSLALFSGCGALVGHVFPGGLNGPPTDGESFAESTPTDLDFQMAFERRLQELLPSAACADQPSHAILTSRSARGTVFLGFCDGGVTIRLRSGGLVHEGLVALSESESRESRGFEVGGMWFRTEVPRAAEVRGHQQDGGVTRLFGKRFDLHVQLSSEPPELAREGCEEVERSGEHLICRRRAGHEMIASVAVGERWLVFRSESRLRATLIEIREMVRAAQLAHRSRR